MRASVADAFKRLPDGRMPPLFHDILDSAVVGIYEGKTPVSTAVFISPTRALTAYHDSKPVVGAVCCGASAPSTKPVRKWKFRVVAASLTDDLVVLEIMSGPEPAHYLSITADPGIDSVADRRVFLATFGIAFAKMTAAAPLDISLGSFVQTVDIAAHSSRHFVYHTSTGKGDSGGAIISFDGELLGVHLGGWNQASPPPALAAPQTASAGEQHPAKAHGGAGAGAGADAAAAAIKNQNRIVDMGLADVDSATRTSIVALARLLTAGGYAIYLGSPAIAALCSAPSSEADSIGGGGSSSGGGTLAGKKRGRAGGGSSSAAAGDSGEGGGGGAAAAPLKKRR